MNENRISWHSVKTSFFFLLAVNIEELLYFHGTHYDELSFLMAEYDARLPARSLIGDWRSHMTVRMAGNGHQLVSLWYWVPFSTFDAARLGLARKVDCRLLQILSVCLSLCLSVPLLRLISRLLLVEFWSNLVKMLELFVQWIVLKFHCTMREALNGSKG